MAGGVAVERYFAVGRVFGTACVVLKCINTVGYVDEPARVTPERANTARCVVVAGVILNKCRLTDRRVVEAVGVVFKYIYADGRVATAARIPKERLKTNGCVV